MNARRRMIFDKAPFSRTQRFCDDSRRSKHVKVLFIIKKGGFVYFQSLFSLRKQLDCFYSLNTSINTIL